MLENDNIKLRALEPSDLNLLFKWENDPVIWQVSNTIAPFSKYILQSYIENSHRDIYETKQLRLMIDIKKEDNEDITIGAIDLFDFEPMHRRAGIGILINDCDNRGKGYATQALILTIDYSFKILQLHQLFCNITSDNEASLNLFKKQGFEIIGIKKDWIRNNNIWKDECMLQRINTD